MTVGCAAFLLLARTGLVETGVEQRAVYRLTLHAPCAGIEQQFRRVSVAGRAASLFVPLPPEAIAPDTLREPVPQER